MTNKGVACQVAPGSFKMKFKADGLIESCVVFFCAGSRVRERIGLALAVHSDTTVYFRW